MIDLFRIKPFPKSLVSQLKNYKEIISIEEQLAAGGFGASIQEELSNNNVKNKVKNFV